MNFLGIKTRFNLKHLALEHKPGATTKPEELCRSWLRQSPWRAFNKWLNRIALCRSDGRLQTDAKRAVKALPGEPRGGCK